MNRLLLPAIAAVCLIGCARIPKPRPPVRTHVAPYPTRIVSIAPSVTEILFAVGSGPKVVAVDDYSNYPPEATSLPRVGAMALNYEKIVALKPDLVIGVSDLQGASLNRLDKLGLKTLRLDTTTYGKTMNAVRDVGSATGCVSGSARVFGAMVKALGEARSAGKPTHQRVLVVVEASPKLFVAGQGTFLDGLLAIVGASNAAEKPGFQMVSLEGLIAMKPGLVLTTTAEDARTLASLLARAHLKTPVLTAPRDSFVRPGPRLADGLTWLSNAVREPVKPR